jgi:hypothetical protein
VNQNWPNDAKASFKTPNNLVNFIDFELDLEHELNEFEDSFEQDALKDN